MFVKKSLRYFCYLAKILIGKLYPLDTPQLQCWEMYRHLTILSTVDFYNMWMSNGIWLLNAWLNLTPSSWHSCFWVCPSVFIQECIVWSILVIKAAWCKLCIISSAWTSSYCIEFEFHRAWKLKSSRLIAHWVLV